MKVPKKSNNNIIKVSYNKVYQLYILVVRFIFINYMFGIYF